MLLCHNTFHILQSLAVRARRLGAAEIPSAAATEATWERRRPPTPHATPRAPPAPSPRSGTSAGIRHPAGDSAPDCSAPPGPCPSRRAGPRHPRPARSRSEEHTSELQSRLHLVCRLLLEKKKYDIGSVASASHISFET